MLKENGSEYNLSEKIYNALFYSDLEYIHNSIYLLMENTKILILPELKNSKYYLGTPMLKTKFL